MKAVGNDRTDQERLVNQLVSVVPEFSPVLREHKEINGELLPHVLFGNLTRWVIDLYRQAKGRSTTREGQDKILDRTLTFLEQKFSDPRDATAHDLIAVSFLENLHQAGPDYHGIKERLGPHLRNWLSRLE